MQGELLCKPGTPEPFDKQAAFNILDNQAPKRHFTTV